MEVDEKLIRKIYGDKQLPTPQDLKQFRLKYDLNTVAAAELICVSRHTWHGWERERSKMLVGTWQAVRIAAYLQIDCRVLLHSSNRDK